MSRPGEVFDGSDFEDECEDCRAPAGALCRPTCPTGYSAETRQKHAEQIERRTPPRCKACTVTEDYDGERIRSHCDDHCLRVQRGDWEHCQGC